jgi:diguanylate cyclase (GGDEF)-like protein
MNSPTARSHVGQVAFPPPRGACLVESCVCASARAPGYGAHDRIKGALLPADISFVARSRRETEQLRDGSERDRLLGVENLVRGSEQDLWRRHLYMGILSFVLGGLLIMGYMALTPDDPHRRILMTLDIVTILGSVFVVGPIGTRSLGAPWRETFFFAWSVGTMVVIAVAIGLDGGAGSPLAGLLVLPVLFGGLLYRLREVLGLAVLAIVSFGLIYATGQSGDSARALASAVIIGVVGGISAMAAMNREIGEQERRALTERLHRLATYDGLTGCLNYQSFQATLINEIQRTERYGRPLSVVIADLDGFKAINDRYGHAAGDSALMSMASTLLAGVRSADLVGRIGGDEFAILLPETLTVEASQLVERLQLAIDSVAAPELTLSFGLSTWHGPDDSPSELLRRADTALYEAKQHGRNCLMVWAPRTHSPQRRAGVAEQKGDAALDVD